MTYFTSDLHLGHSNIIRMCNRPFHSVEEMNDTLIDNWNSRVTEHDDIYILGDLFYKAALDVNNVLKNLKGKKHLIIGNHDYTWMNNCDLSAYFASIDDLLVLKDSGSVMVLCHYPMLSWPHMFHGSYCLFGHIHNSRQKDDGWEYIKEHDHLLNAGVDINGFYPVTFEELLENNRVFKSI